MIKEFKRDATTINSTFTHVGVFNVDKPTTSDESDLKTWLSLLWDNKKVKKQEPTEEQKVNISETYYPIVF